MKEIPTSKISLSGLNPRSDEAYKDEEFQDLKTSIQENGFFPHQALLVRPLNGGYQLIAGHRRLAAVKELGIKKVPVTIQEFTDSEAKLILAADNFNRVDFKPMEEAAYLQKLLEDEDITQDELGGKLGKSQSYIANRLRLLAAPEELKEMVISREISPKHVIALLPYSRYPVFEEILSDLKEEITENGKISVVSLEKLIIDTMSPRGNENVLNIDDVGFDYRRYVPYMDFSKCGECEHIKKINKYGDENRYCLNWRCWKDVVNKAKRVYEKEQTDLLANMTASDVVHTSKMEYGTYEHLKYVKWSKKGCKGCDTCKLDEDNDLICLDPPCFKKKERAYTKEQNKGAREEAEKVWTALEEMLAGTTVLGEGGLRFVVLQLSKNIIWTAAVKKAYTPWKELVKKGSELPAVKDIPAEDLTRLLLRLVIIQRMNGGNGLPTMDQFGRAVEGVPA